MPSQGLAQLILVILIIAFCIIGLIIFPKHKKTAVVLLCIAAFWISSFFRITSLVKDGEKIRTGTFHLDVLNSKYDSIDLSIYKHIMLKVNTDNTFKITGNCPLVTDSTGKWNYEDDGDIFYTEYKIGGNDMSQMQGDGGADTWIFTEGLRHESKYNRLVFVR